jgi:hypothetical protein
MNESVALKVITGSNVPSFKNRKRAILDKNTGRMRTLTEPDIKRRMRELEAAIESALYSWSQTGVPETDLECRKQLRIALSGLQDDSLKEIPEFSFGVRYVEAGQEGVEITIEPFIV